MDTSDDADRGYGLWRAWTGRAHWVFREDGSTDFHLSPESWPYETEPYDGSAILDEFHNELPDELAAASIARLLVVQVAASAVRRQKRAEDLSDDVAEAAAYIAALDLPLTEQLMLTRLLAALAPYDAAAAGAELLGLCWTARREGLDSSARCCAELAYEAALVAGLDDLAHGAAHALARLALMQECPRAARKWRRIAAVHMLRAWRTRTPGNSASRSKPR